VETPLQTDHDIRQRIWVELQRATHDRHHEWRTPVLATVGLDGLPGARTVVLRQAEAGSACLAFYTDSRSPKVAELMAAPHASFVFWSKRLSWQLRVHAHITVQTSGPQVDEVWERMRQSPAAGDYLAAAAPGALLPGASEPPAPAGLQHHLAIVTAQVLAIDWLELARTGHRRAALTGTTFEWRVP
jgi:general stress protein 26